MVSSSHTESAPFMIPASTDNGITVIVVVADELPHRLVIVYEINAVPSDTPDTTPVGNMVATAVFALPHKPPAIAFPSNPSCPKQTLVLPVITPESGLLYTVTGCLVTPVPQPVVILYLTVSNPVVIPVTAPAVDTETLPVAVLHTPPAILGVNEKVAAGQTPLAPDNVPAVAVGLTVTTTVLIHPLNIL
jgi:hypothetical protein